MLTIHRFRQQLSAALGVALLLVHAWVLAETDSPERIEWKKAPIRLELTVGKEQRIDFPSAVKVGEEPRRVRVAAPRRAQHSAVV